MTSVKRFTGWHILTALLLVWNVLWFFVDVYNEEFVWAAIQLGFGALAAYWTYNVWIRGRSLWGAVIGPISTPSMPTTLTGRVAVKMGGSTGTGPSADALLSRIGTRFDLMAAAIGSIDNKASVVLDKASAVLDSNRDMEVRLELLTQERDELREELRSVILRLEYVEGKVGI